MPTRLRSGNKVMVGYAIRVDSYYTLLSELSKTGTLKLGKTFPCLTLTPLNLLPLRLFFGFKPKTNGKKSVHVKL